MTELLPAAGSVRRTVTIAVALMTGQLVLCSVIGWVTFGDLLTRHPAGRAEIMAAPAADTPLAEFPPSPAPAPTDAAPTASPPAPKQPGPQPSAPVQEPVEVKSPCAPANAVGRTDDGRTVRCLRTGRGDLRWRVIE